MRKLIMLAAPLALVACAEPATEEETVVDEEMTEAEAPAITTANGTAGGIFDVTLEDGSPGGVSTLNSDGTFTDTDADGTVVNEGTWAVVDGKTCFTSAGEEGEEVECWTESEAGEDGSFTATSDAGEVVTVSPQA